MIEAVHISKRFGSFSVLSDISLRVGPGEIYGLIGYNGVGKTTLMKILSGIYRPDQGRAVIGGQPVYEDPAVKRRCFFMTEEAAFFPQSSLLQMQKFYRGYYPAWREETFEGLVEWSGMDPKKKISQFSKGMQRLAGLLLALSSHADCLFLDEAFDGLDYTIRRQVRGMLRHYAREKRASLLISSHNLQELEGLADGIGMLNEGALIFDGPTEKMREDHQTCTFRLPAEREDGLARLHAELIEKEGSGWLCILKASKWEARARLEEIGAKEIQVRPVRLEEFFRIERKERDVDWEKIFGHP